MRFAASIVFTGNTWVRMAQEKTAWAPREASFLEATRTAHQQAAKAWSVTGCSGQFAVLKNINWELFGGFLDLPKPAGPSEARLAQTAMLPVLTRRMARSAMPGVFRREIPQLLSVLNCPRIFISPCGHMKGILNPQWLEDWLLMEGAGYCFVKEGPSFSDGS